MNYDSNLKNHIIFIFIFFNLIYIYYDFSKFYTKSASIMAIDLKFFLSLNINLYNNCSHNQLFHFWKDIIRYNYSDTQINKIMNNIFPFYRMNQKVFFFDPDKEVNISNENIYGTKEIQKLIMKNQFPKDCSDRNFILFPKLHYQGIGSTIHALGAIIAKGMNTNRTVIFSLNCLINFFDHKICEGKIGFDCFHNPISNCFFKSDEINSDPGRFLKFSHDDVFKSRYEIPKSIIKIIDKSATPKKLYYFYWRIQATFFIVRLNNNAKKLLHSFRNKYLINPKSKYDVSIHIRNGDKFLEMKLVDTNNYIYPLEILYVLFKRKLSIFVSSDAQPAIDYFASLKNEKFEISYFNYQRPNKGYYLKNLTNGFNNAVQSYSNLLESINSHYVIGTLQSNWNRLIIELRLQYQSNMEYPYFEVGDIHCITPYQCKKCRTDIDFGW